MTDEFEAWKADEAKVWLGSVVAARERAEAAKAMAEAMEAHGWKYQAFVTAEVKHHQFMEAQQLGVTLYDASHYATEVVSIPWLTRRLAQGLGSGIPVSMAEAYQGQILD